MTVSAGIRRRGRWYAIQVLYALDLNPDEAPERAVADYAERFALELDERSIAFGRDLVVAFVDHRADIDQAIQKASRNWRLERMSRVDRNILRLAACELLYVKDAPMRVIINEAVELAKRFGATESPAFINGILDRVVQSAANE